MNILKEFFYKKPPSSYDGIVEYLTLQEGLITPINTSGVASVSVIGSNPVEPTKINICRVPMYLYYNMYLSDYTCR